MLSAMTNPFSLLRIAGFVLAVLLVISSSPSLSHIDDLGRGQFPVALSAIAISAESDAYDGNRVIRRIYSGAANNASDNSAGAQILDLRRGRHRPPASARKLYQLNVIFLI